MANSFRNESEFVPSLDSRYFTLLLTCLALSFLALACAGWGVKSSLPRAWKFMAIFVNAEKSSKNSLPIWCCFFFVLAPISFYFLFLNYAFAGAASIYRYYFLLSVVSHLISKCLFGAIVWTKMPTKFFPEFLP